MILMNKNISEFILHVYSISLNFEIFNIYSIFMMFDVFLQYFFPHNVKQRINVHTKKLLLTSWFVQMPSVFRTFKRFSQRSAQRLAPTSECLPVTRRERGGRTGSHCRLIKCNPRVSTRPAPLPPPPPAPQEGCFRAWARKGITL